MFTNINLFCICTPSLWFVAYGSRIHDKGSSRTTLSVKCNNNSVMLWLNNVQIIRSMRDVTAFAELPIKMQNKLAEVGRYER